VFCVLKTSIIVVSSSHNENVKLLHFSLKALSPTFAMLVNKDSRISDVDRKLAKNKTK